VHYRLSCDYGSRLSLRSAGTTAERLGPRSEEQRACRQRYTGPGLGSGAGVCPHSALFPSPSKRGGWRAERRMPWISPGRPDSCSGESGTPDPGAHDASARASRRATAASFRFRVYGGRTRTEPVLLRGGCPAAARGCGCIGHTRRCRVPPHLVRCLGRSTPQSAELTARLVNITRGVNESGANDYNSMIATHDPIELPHEYAVPVSACSPVEHSTIRERSPL